MSELELKDDLIRGADAIGRFIFGDDPGARRKIYYLSSEAKGDDKLPIFKLGAVICARRSTLLRWIAERESA
ncbi:MAG TPA: hypothetical protein VGU20_06735 [Stellaceae bacterium]|nr:hypothetical protein [Stellaceae bacterium]